MRTLPAGLAVHLASGVTTLCWCWRVERRDGVVLGFTDHDRDLEFDGTIYRASSGLSASEMRQTVGLQVDDFDVESALSDATLTEQDLANGLFDAAVIEIHRVNWNDVAERVLIRSGTIGEVDRAGAAFKAEVRGLSNRLQQPRGRLYQFTCDADLGDARCGISLSSPQFTGDAVITAVVGPRHYRVSGLSAFSSGWFTHGLLRWISGANAGAAVEIRRHVRDADGDALELWHAPAGPVLPGDVIRLTAGCDKRLATCRDRFSNAVNFRGFPHMPGNDFVLSVARAGDGPRGGSIR
ncbi:MAG: DUF2163 domain-containing protein [Rhizobiales bacterium]|nr:DUF2163 domain-containing protein [Hyphomicrobiales bacterium]